MNHAAASIPLAQKWYARPVFIVANLQVALTFYLDVLRFSKKWHSRDGAGSVCQVDRGECEIILSEEATRRGTSRLFVELTGDGIDELRREIAERSIPVRKGVWGYDVIQIVDPDGNELLFPLDETNDRERHA